MKHKYVDQIKKHEIKAENVTVMDKGHEIEVPNGYEEGGKSIGQIYSKQYKENCLNRHDEWEEWTTTALLPKEKTLTWGGDDELEKYPKRVTFTAGTMVFYLNKGTDASSPLIVWFSDVSGPIIYKGSLTLTFHHKGLTSAHVNEKHLEYFRKHGVSWSQGFTCRKKKRGE